MVRLLLLLLDEVFFRDHEVLPREDEEAIINEEGQNERGRT